MKIRRPYLLPGASIRVLAKLSITVSAIAFLASSGFSQDQAAKLPKHAAVEISSPVPRTVSESRQFIIFSNDASQRLQLARQVEEIKLDLRNALQIKDVWEMPILINLEPDATERQRRRAPVRLSFLEGENNALRLQLDILDPGLAGGPDFEIEIIRCLLLELAYRNISIRAGRPFQEPPDWLVEAIFERSRVRSSRADPVVYASLISTSTPPDLRDFLRLRPSELDSTSRALFRAQAYALLETLIELPNGPAGIQSYVSGLRRNPATIEEILSFFPSLENDRASLGRRWILAIAKNSASDRVNLLGSRETAKELDRILNITALPDPKNPEVGAMSGPYALEAIAKSQNGRFTLIQLRDEMLRLTIRAHPMFQPVVREYLQILSDLISRPKRRVDKRIAVAEEVRAGLRLQNSEVESYLDWVEANKLNTENEVIATAIEEADTIDAPPPRADRISRHIDTIMERGW